MATNDTGKTWSGKGPPVPQRRSTDNPSPPPAKAAPKKTGKTWSGNKNK